jgi:site-specific recombinase XerD
MIRDMELQRLAPRTQEASIAAVAGLAKFSGRSPDQLHPDQIRAYLHHLLVERHRAWSSCNQVACGRKFFSGTTLGWDALHLNLPPRTGRRLLPHLMRVEALQRFFTSAANPRHRALLMTTYAAGLRVGEVVRLPLSDIASDRRLIRVNQGKGRQDRSTLLSARLLTALRTYWHLYRPARWLLTGQDRTQPLSIATAQTISDHAKRSARITHGKGMHTLRHCCATHLLEAGVDLHTIPLLRGHRTIDPTTRSLHITRRHLAKVHSPFDLPGVAEGLPSVTTEGGHACHWGLPP